MPVRRILVEKKKGYDIEPQELYRDLKEYLGISGLESVRVVNRYDVEGLNDEAYERSLHTIFSEPPVDNVYEEKMEIGADEAMFAIEYLPGQYDQRADSASQCIQILTCGERPDVRVARLIILKGKITDDELSSVKNYCINPVESREAGFEKPASLKMEIVNPPDVQVVSGFVGMDDAGLEELASDMGFAMPIDDLRFCRDHFASIERRDPTVTELRVIDTYWSDHCRHTTFLSKIENVEFDEGHFRPLFDEAYGKYISSRQKLYVNLNQNKIRDMSLMDLATIAAKVLRKEGKLEDLDTSDEINACSIKVDAGINGRREEWLVMFKNETHNHPTEIEPFGGAATCLGGAIRDPLSGRAYVYQAMRVTGSGDPRLGLDRTLPGKLPQRKITTGAAAGYSSYGNQIGLSTGQVAELYDEGFVAKRMEIGAVIAAAPTGNVLREKPLPGDVVILLGGRTGRDGCGGATGSSKEHDENSLANCGAEVQKGNPPTERKIQRLFRKKEVSVLIKKCNDFGAGGVSVAIGELADGLDINLDAVPKKYEGLDGTELAISESQERMAVVVAAEDAPKFISFAAEENLEATPVAVVNGKGRLRMNWRGKTIVDLSREFLDTNGVKQHVTIKTALPDANTGIFAHTAAGGRNSGGNDIKTMWSQNLRQLNVCSQKGLVERFDSTIGAGTVLMPFGGKYQLTPQEGMAAMLPVVDKSTETATLMTYGYNPEIGAWSPFHGAVYSIVESVAKIAAMGGDFSKIRFTFQEYFEKLGMDPYKWGKPFSALLGALLTQLSLDIPSIGGKDSMSGTFKDLNVPPTLVSFAVAPVIAANVVSAEFKNTDTIAVLLPVRIDKYMMPDFGQMKANYSRVFELVARGRILAAHSVRNGGISEAISKMCFGNMIGFEFSGYIRQDDLFKPGYGSLILEVRSGEDVGRLFGGVEYQVLGKTTMLPTITVRGVSLDLADILSDWEQPLEKVFPTMRASEVANRPIKTDMAVGADDSEKTSKVNKTGRVALLDARPRIFIPVFPGTNCEYDTAQLCEKAGGTADVFIVRNLTPRDMEDTISEMARRIADSQMIIIPGGFSGGDEPDGSGKFIATAFRNPYVAEAITDLLNRRDGLILGICNGFQALIKLGLVPYGEIRDMDENSPTLTYNAIGRHMSCMVRTKVVSKLSPWLAYAEPGEIHCVPVSHGEGRFIATEDDISKMFASHQVATQYVDFDGNPSADIRFNPNGSMMAVEGITSPDGRVFGKMAHSERVRQGILKNVPGNKDQKLFQAGVDYFR